MSDFDRDVLDLAWDDRGLIPAVVQDVSDGTVLMLAYVNMAALEATIETGLAHFWSRSRQQLWQKGETSGNILHIHAVHYDCDGDTLLYEVTPTGPACHTGNRTCFFRTLYRKEPADGAIEFLVQSRQRMAQTHVENSVTTSNYAVRESIIGRLEQLITARNEERPDGSYTTYLFESGQDKILKKVGEEAAETIIASKNHNHDELVYETADLIYHLLVLLTEHEISWTEIEAELERRHMENGKE